MALITEDRKVTGLNLSGSVNDNIAMVAIKKLLSHGLYNKNKARAASMEYIKKLNIKTPSGDQITGNLSGGKPAEDCYRQVAAERPRYHHPR